MLFAQGLRPFIVLVGLWSGVCIPAFAQDPDAAKVMLVGVFHFANPGLDKVKTDQINVMTGENQRYLQSLAERLAGFKPTHVLLECDPGSSADYQEKYQRYLQRGELPGTNENFQLGFRIAKSAGLKSLHCYNESSVSWDADQLFSDMNRKAVKSKQAFDQLISSITAETERNHQTLSLAELLRLSNDAAQDRLNKYLYILTNDVGAGDNFSGADAAASWWHRNFRMYANVQKVAQPGTRVLVMGGQGHTAILKDLLDLDQQRERVDSQRYF